MTLAASIMSGPGPVLPIAVGVVAVIMIGTWLLSLRLHDASIVDPVWGPAFAVVALVAALVGVGDPARRWLLLGLTAVWGLRLGLHLTRRKLADPEEDRRYAAMRTAHASNFALWSLGWIYGVQGLLIVVVSLPVQAAAGSDSRLGLAVVPGIVVYCVGLAFEAVGDEQLRRFKSAPGSRGKVMDRGLWRYTRHPNYFGDACVWWGLWLVSLQAGGMWWTVISPVVMSVLLVRISGKGLLERDIGERRPEYADYVRRTSGFVPRPPLRTLRRKPQSSR